MSRGLQVAPWGALRVAGMPADALAGLRLRESPAVERELAVAELELAAARADAAARMFDVVRGCEDEALRRAALEVKRRLFNEKAVAAGALEGARTAPPEGARAALALVDARAARCAALEERYEATFAAEWIAASERFRKTLGSSRLLGGILLSSADHHTTAQKLAEIPGGAPLTSAQQIREATIARYVFRATARTTPFAGFAGVALLDLSASPEGVCSAPRTAEEARWRSLPQLALAHAGELVARAMSSSSFSSSSPASPAAHAHARARLPLRMNPLRRFTAGAAPSVVFSRAGSGELMSLGWTPAVARLVEGAEGRTLEDAARALASDDADERACRDVLEQLVEAGMLEPASVPMGPTPAGLRAAADALGEIGCAGAPDELRSVARRLEDYATADVETRARLAVELGRGPGRSALLEDVMVDGAFGAELPVPRGALAEALDPVVRFVRASACGAAHRRLCAAFVERFGRDGVCDDVGGFVTEILEDPRRVAVIRGASEPIRWIDAELGRVAAAATGDVVRLDPGLFEGLAAPDAPSSMALFLQIAPPCPRDGGAPRVVLNGAQAGRAKYLSRYLADAEGRAPEALEVIRRRLALEDGPLPVELSPTLGLNFQVHPRLTEWALELPWEPSAPGDKVLPLRDLSLRFDAAAVQLRLRSRRLGREIEPIHLGFLRDAALPDPHFLLRALSPRLRDDTVAERADLYNVLDRLDLARGVALAPRRPRLTVGRVVVERARWAIPVSAIPRKEPKQPYASYFRAIARLRRELDLPGRGFARYVGPEVAGYGFTETNMYVDWESPFTLIGLARLLGGPGDVRSGYLVFTELLPEPEASWLRLDGRPHAAELLVEIDGERSAR
ncbi:lantibiotic dehydratase [Sorangium sp. So ce117]|uniref:lantibiotic dehydratase n=1 Tax=Sorangium sp. So ce117 TaxID=3133277 RepID=UPI003F5D8572